MAQFARMELYFDRSDTWNDRKQEKVANDCLKNQILLWDCHSICFDDIEGNPFLFRFSGIDCVLKNEYLMSLDFMSVLLSVYKNTGKEVYKEKYLELFSFFVDYINLKNPLMDGVEMDLPIMGQIFLAAKMLDILGYIPNENDYYRLMELYGTWLLNEDNWKTKDNHGLFQILSLLHLSVLLEDSKAKDKFRSSAIRYLKLLYSNVYLEDGVNREYSFLYFSYNNALFRRVIDFCRFYNIDLDSEIEEGIETAEKAFLTLANLEGVYPVIGDGHVLKGKESNDISRLFPDGKIAVVKLGKIYLTFKNGTEFTTHAHADLMSITARYNDFDIVIDSGQYNYERYSPINRFVRSSAGHSSIFPLFADGLFLREFCGRISSSKISVFEVNEEYARIIGEMEIDDVCTRREILVYCSKIVVTDSWECRVPRAIRQRFVVPQIMLEHSRFSASDRTLSSRVKNADIKYVISAEDGNTITLVNFGVASPEYNMYETTMLLDTIAENSLQGKITATISISEE